MPVDTLAVEAVAQTNLGELDDLSEKLDDVGDEYDRLEDKLREPLSVTVDATAVNQLDRRIDDLDNEGIHIPVSSGNFHVNTRGRSAEIDVEIREGHLENQLDEINPVTIDAYLDVQDVLREDVEHAGSNPQTGSPMFRDTETNQFVSAQDAFGLKERDVPASLAVNGVTGPTPTAPDGSGDASASSDGGDDSGMDQLTLGDLRRSGAFDDTNLRNFAARRDVGRMVVDQLEGDEVDLDDTPVSASALARELSDGVSAEDVTKINSERDLRSLMNEQEGGSLLGRVASRVDFDMEDLHELTSDMIPLLGVFVGALPAAIAGLTALAGAALAAAAGIAAVGGLGVIGMMMAGPGDGLSFTPLREELNQTQETFMNAFGPIARDFAPVIRQAFESIRVVIRRLGSASGVLRGFVDPMMRGMALLERTVPTMLVDIARLGKRMMPLLFGAAEWLMSLDVASLIGDLIADVAPMLVFLAEGIRDLAPTLIQLSVGFLQAAVGVISLVGAFLKLFDILYNLHPAFKVVIQGLGLFIGLMLTAITVLSLYNTVAQLSLPSLAVFDGAVASAVGSLQSFVASANLATIAATAFLGVLTMGAIAGAIGIVISQISKMRSELEKTTEAMSNFNSAGDNLGGFGSSGFGGSGSSGGAFVSVSNTHVDADSTGEAVRQADAADFGSGDEDDEFMEGI